MLTVTPADKPGASRAAAEPSEPAAKTIFTGTRWTTFVKLPVALSGGSSENLAPVPGAKLSTTPWNTLPGSASTVTSAFSPGRRWVSWFSLKFATTQTSSLTTDMTGWPGCRRWPTSTLLRHAASARGADDGVAGLQLRRAQRGLGLLDLGERHGALRLRGGEPRLGGGFLGDQGLLRGLGRVELGARRIKILPRNRAHAVGGEHFHAVKVDLDPLELRGVLRDARRGRLDIGLRAGDLRRHLRGGGAGLGEIRLGALHREVQVGRVDLHQGLPRDHVGVVVHEHSGDRSVDPGADRMDVALEERVVGGLEAGGMVNIAADRGTDDGNQRGATDNAAPQQAADGSFGLHDRAGGCGDGEIGLSGNGDGGGVHGGEVEALSDWCRRWFYRPDHRISPDRRARNDFVLPTLIAFLYQSGLMELRHLRYFAAVAGELNFRKASGQLRVAQPALSSQIKDLEHELGVRLLDRDTGGVRLTDAGAAFLAEVHLILAHAQQAVAVAREAAKGRRGRLAIGYFAPLLMGLMPPALKAFHAKFPDVDVALLEMPLGEQLAALEAGTIHIGFSLDPKTPVPRGLQSTNVARAPIRAVVGRSHRMAQVARISLADVTRCRLLCFTAQQGLPSIHGEIMRGIFAARGLKTGPIRVIDGPEAFRATLESGQGVSLMAELGSFSRSGELVFKPLQETGPDLFVELRGRSGAATRLPSLPRISSPCSSGPNRRASHAKNNAFLPMKKINTRDLPEESWASPKGTFQGFGKGISIALGRVPGSTDLMKRHPFDVELLRIAPGQKPYPYHSHSAQWEFYHVLAGRGTVRDKDGTTAIVAGDAFIFPPDEPHGFLNDGTEDLIICVVADNPFSESCHYPDSKKWLVRSPERKLIREPGLDYYDGEE